MCSSFHRNQHQLFESFTNTIEYYSLFLISVNKWFLVASKPVLEKLNYSSVRFVFCQEIIIKCIHIFNHLLHTWKNVVLRSYSLFLTWQVTQISSFHAAHAKYYLSMEHTARLWCYVLYFLLQNLSGSSLSKFKNYQSYLAKWWKCHKRGAGISYLPLVKMVLRREQEAFYGTGSLMSSN